MPIPNAAQIASLVNANDIPPPHNQKFSTVLGVIVSDAFTNFFKTAQILPGIKTTAIPPANSGTTVVPGKLVAPAASDAARLMKVSAKTKELGLDDGQKNTLDKMLAEGLSLSLAALSGATMMPGVMVAGNVTASPGKLVAPNLSTLQMQVEQKIRKFAPQFHIPAAPVFDAQSVHTAASVPKGACLPKDPVKVISDLMVKSSTLFIDYVIVAPGIQCAPGVTVGIGKLI